MYRLFLGLVAGMFLATQLSAQSEEDAGALLGDALRAGEAGDWSLAVELGQKINGNMAGEIIEWQRLRSDFEADWFEYEEFLARNADWPGLSLLRTRGEKAIPEGADAARVLAYFKKHRPQSGEGAIRLASALWSSGQKDAARAEAIRVWTSFSLTKSTQQILLQRYGKTLKPYHDDRLDMLLWRGLRTQSEAMYTLVSNGQVRLAKARLGLRKKAKGVDGLISAVPASLLDDPGLAYDRFVWRARKDRELDAIRLLQQRSTSAKNLGKPEKWSNRRRRLARKLMRQGEGREAYELASRHFLTSGSDYADLEWLSGYIALRELKDPALALMHFQRFQAAVATPISFGRAGYWTGRAYDALGQSKKADEAYHFAAKYQTSFYGQLAAEKIDAKPDLSLLGREEFPDWRRASFISSPLIEAGLLLHYANRAKLSEQFFRAVAEGQDRTGFLQLTDLAMDIGRPNIAVRVAKLGARKGYVIPNTYFPLHKLAKLKTDLKPEIAMSIARRESELDQYIISPAGARGLMQLMPGTAKKVAKENGLPYSKERLTSDWRYNATLGSSYLATQLENFNGSYILSFAAYNAGPSRARQWIKQLGDPRPDSVDQIDWIENIPFRETRNYVMRVMESLHVYRARIKGRVPPISISKDLKRG